MIEHQEFLIDWYVYYVDSISSVRWVTVYSYPVREKNTRFSKKDKWKSVINNDMIRKPIRI